MLRPTDKRPPEPWHGLDLRGRVAPTLTGPDTADLAVRHHVCELHIGASHLAWHASVGDDESLYWALRQLDELLESGPRRQPVDAP